MNDPRRFANVYPHYVVIHPDRRSAEASRSEDRLNCVAVAGEVQPEANFTVAAAIEQAKKLEAVAVRTIMQPVADVIQAESAVDHWSVPRARGAHDARAAVLERMILPMMADCARTPGKGISLGNTDCNLLLDALAEAGYFPPVPAATEAPPVRTQPLL